MTNFYDEKMRMVLTFFRKDSLERAEQSKQLIAASYDYVRVLARRISLCTRQHSHSVLQTGCVHKAYEREREREREREKDGEREGGGSIGKTNIRW